VSALAPARTRSSFLEVCARSDRHPGASGQVPSATQQRLKRPWSLIATTPVTTSRSSRASNVFFGVDGIDRIERNGKHCAGANQVEGLVRDNRVEVRVLFGACTKAPLCRGFRRSQVDRSTWGPHFATTPYDNWAAPMRPRLRPTSEGFRCTSTTSRIAAGIAFAGAKTASTAAGGSGPRKRPSASWLPCPIRRRNIPPMSWKERTAAVSTRTRPPTGDGGDSCSANQTADGGAVSGDAWVWPTASAMPRCSTGGGLRSDWCIRSRPTTRTSPRPQASR